MATIKKQKAESLLERLAQDAYEDAKKYESDGYHESARICADRSAAIQALAVNYDALHVALKELRAAVNPIIDPSVTAMNVDGTLDLLNAARKADALLD